MEIGEIISDSVKYPSSDWTKIIILAVILLIPIVNFIGLGYILRIIKATLAGLNELPDFDEVGDMFIDGLKVLIVGIVYAIPIWIIAAIIGAIIGVVSPAATTYYVGADATAMIGGMIASYAVLLIVALIVGLIEIIAIANMAYYDGDIGAAFHFSDILNYIATIGWGKYLIVYITIAIIGAVISILAMFIGLLLLFVGVFITMPLAMSYIYMFGSRAIAMLFADALAETPV
ncbi:DUF4013 domain-containing protein [Methanobacterium petrolearium]|uniref:DUF4013 domain-containing protein n=1 Tax=Methanobacterium petrolearium TaxID=710190 RepID=UPI001AE2D5FC|nr:DUF4013 domain-containing protein [Methanobacterium petrolearium]MBP1947065.1 putative membrane protein [Methanobacterium petrolearium]BDZ69712.1 hypothetical protein GCM10025861_02290 [Methanobacterium petrolearium]